MSVECNLCLSSRYEKQLEIQGHDLVKCLDCSLRYLNPIPTDEDITTMYSKAYYESSDSNKVGYSNYKKDVNLIIMTVLRRYKMIIDKIKLKDNMKLLDIGCAYGYYLDIARLYGWDVTGVEINDAAASECVEVTKLNVKQMSLKNTQFPDNHFDVVTSWDLIEHLQDPKSFMEEVSRILKPGGSYVLTTPDIDSLPAKIMGKRWMGYKSKEHIYFFSQETLTEYCRAAGLEVEECCYVGKYISRDLFLDRLNYYFGPVSHVAKLITPAEFYLNPFDIIYLRAVKK